MGYQHIENIIASSLRLPIAYCVWNCNEDYLYVSNHMMKLTGIRNNTVMIRDFLDATRKIFGNFFEIGSEYVEIHGVYKKKINNLTATLMYDRLAETYLFFIIEETNKAEINPIDILNMLPIYVWQRNADLNLVFCNKKYADALETSVQTVVSNNMKLPTTTSSRGASLEQMALASGKPQTSRKHVIINGGRKLLEFTEFPLNTKTSQIGYAIDITEEEKIQKEYETYKKQTNQTFNQISVPIAIFDINTKLIFANSAIQKLFEIEESYAMSQPYFGEIVDLLMEKRKLPEVSDHQKFKQKLLNYFRDIVDPYHLFVHTPDNHSLNIIMSPNYGGGLIIVCEDITEKITIEREYNALSAVQKATLDHLHDGILVFGTDNRIKMINPAITSIWQISDENNCYDMHIKTFFSSQSDLFISLDDYETWISQVINMGEQRNAVSGIINLKSGKNIDYAYVPLPDGLNLIRFADITDRITLEKTLIEKNEIMSQLDRLKSNFIANMSYEIKSPINTITGFSDILLNQYFGQLNDRQMEYCASILNAANKLAEMVDTMLNLASIEAGPNRMQYKSINLQEFLEGTIALFNQTIRNKNISVIYSLTSSTANIYFDENSMKQAMFQLLSMIIKTTPIGENITISSNDTTDTPNYIDISIKNKGISLSHEEIQRLQQILSFDHNNKSTPTTTSDFGILFANHVIKLHNGKIFIRSTQNAESEIMIRLPVKPLFS